MAALSRIIEKGFTVTLAGDGFEITPAKNLTDTQREFLKSHKAEIVAELKQRQATNDNLGLSQADKSNIMAWLDSIGEHDHAMIQDVLNQCRTDVTALQYFLMRSNEVPQALDDRHYCRNTLLTHFFYETRLPWSV
ncbi:MAG: hypothetical protein Q8N96_07670 [Methylovulum sp.]|nr:hypothetical protein [Methylovulum sp.]